MNKSEFIDAMAEELGLSVRVASGIVETILQTMIESLANGENIEIRGFGSFKMKRYDTYTGHNPKTGELVQVKPKKLPFFRPGKELKTMVSGF